MPPFRTTALPVMGTLMAAGVLLAWHQGWAQSSPSARVGEEMRRAQNDFAAGGIRRLSTNWYACTDQARASQDANAAEGCVIYGYSALLLSDSNGAAARTPWIRHLTSDILAPGQLEMLEIMGIPEGPRQAWLDRYRRWVAERYTYTPDVEADTARTADVGDVGVPDDDTPRRAVPRGGGYGGTTHNGSQDDAASSGSPRYDGAPYGGVPRRVGPYGGAPYSPSAGGVGPYADAPAGAAGFGGGRGNLGGQVNLAQSADGKYPREALRDPDIAGALRDLVGPAVFGRLKDYSFGTPMEYSGRFTVGIACEPRGCGVAEARYVFAPEEVWIALVGGGRMRIYGDPPRPVRALLLRDRNQIVWRGTIEDMSHQAPPRLIPVAVNPSAGGPPLRMTIAPHSLPVAADPAPVAQPLIAQTPQGAQTQGGQTLGGQTLGAQTQGAQTLGAQTLGDATEIRLRLHDGTFEVPVTINGAMTLPFAIDSGASDVSVSSEVMQKLIQAGTVSRSDFLGKQVYHLADGSSVASETFRIHALKVGDREVRDVMGSVTNDAESLLLGQSFLKRFRSWSIDNQRQVLLLK